MKIDDQKIKELLIREKYVSPENIKKGEESAKEGRTTITQYLMSNGLITNDLLGQAIAESFGIQYANLNAVKLPPAESGKISETAARDLRIAVTFEDDKNVTVATDSPERPDLKDELKKLFPSKDVKLVFSMPEDIDEIFVQYQKPLETRFSKIIEKKGGRIAPELLEEIFDDALVYNASDIHFEPQRKNVIIRFRVDGVLHEAGRVPKEFYENILNRIKVKSSLRIDEHFAAQDGSLQHEKGGVVIDMRTSIVPTIEGEKTVLRVLAAYIQTLTLSDLGLSKTHQKLLEDSADKPFGMILVVGPTGSGKTTTLYALVRLANTASVNITTIEDPVEYKVQGVNQIQVNQQTDLTFAKGLRSIVRQDPDIILVGEIRDNETAEISLNAALTGHLLYSTFHANDAATAIPRLLDMSIEPFLLASTLEVIIAQRLVRKICPECRFSVTKKQEDFNAPQLKSVAAYFPEKSITLYEGKGCQACGNTGYKGRTAIFEFIRMTPDMQNLILRSPSSQEIWQLARKEGSRSLFEDGIDKVKAGATTLEELLRVAEPPKQK